MTNTTDLTDTTAIASPDASQRVSRRTLAIMAATVAAAGVVAAPSVVAALESDTTHGSIGDVHEVIEILPVPDTLPPVEPAPDTSPDIDVEWRYDDGMDWDNCPACGLG